jgi:hypothetical protein
MCARLSCAWELIMVGWLQYLWWCDTYDPLLKANPVRQQMSTRRGAVWSD